MDIVILKLKKKKSDVNFKHYMLGDMIVSYQYFILIAL